ncbi:MAG: PAS domain S-box protein [Deltaproteobacteria bacterium]|nr:PAS domain S-box protein [Deltaproteobacteria bacterium]
MDNKCEDCLVEKSFLDGHPHESEERVVMKDGRIAHMRIRSTPVSNRWGEIMYVLETATDITEKDNLENELSKVSNNLENLISERLNLLQESEKRYRTIFERSLDAIILFDSNGKILEINQAGVEMFGYRTKETVLSLKSVVGLFENREDLYRFRKIVEAAGYVKEFETKFVGKGGRTFDVLITSNVILDAIGLIAGYVIIIRDVTKRIKAQRQIQRRNIRLAALKGISMAVSSSLDLKKILDKSIENMLEIHEILEPASVRIYLLDEHKEGLNLAAHKGLSENFTSKSHMKYRRVGDGLLGQTLVDGKIKVVDNYSRLEDPYVDTIVKEEGLHSTVYVPLQAKGNTLGVLCVSSHSPFKFSSYHVEFLAAVGHQIGVAVENSNLYEKSKRAYEELKEAQEQVVRAEKLASLGKLSATIAHEINNPLAAVLTYVRLMMKLMDRGIFNQERSDDIKRYLDTMESETARCGEIVKNLLAFSRHSKIIIQSHRIEEIIERTLVLIAHDLDMKDIRLIKEIESDLPDIRCDFRQIQQALLNLMSNASESMSNGGTLSVSAKCPERDEFVEVTISDTGCGISEENLKNIFEPFFTTKEEGKGVGLGLSVVFGIITKHNGSIEIESKPEEGTSFKVKLPVA